MICFVGGLFVLTLIKKVYTLFVIGPFVNSQGVFPLSGVCRTSMGHQETLADPIVVIFLIWTLLDITYVLQAFQLW